MSNLPSQMDVIKTIKQYVLFSTNCLLAEFSTTQIYEIKGCFHQNNQFLRRINLTLLTKCPLTESGKVEKRVLFYQNEDDNNCDGCNDYHDL